MPQGNTYQTQQVPDHPKLSQDLARDAQAIEGQGSNVVAKPVDLFEHLKRAGTFYLQTLGRIDAMKITVLK